MAVQFTKYQLLRRMAMQSTPGGGSRAAKKRRKSSGIRDDDGNHELSNKVKKQEITEVVNDKKKDNFSADSLSKASLELADASSIAALSSSSGPKATSHDELLKLSLKEVLALEEITEVDCPTRGAVVLSIILSPYDRSTFYSDYWEKRPMHCACDIDKKRSVKGLLSSKQFRNILKSQSILYGLDVTTSKIKADYSSLTSDKSSPSQVDEEELVEAKESELLEHFRDRFSIRLLCPQKFHDPLWSMLSILEFEFGSRVGCRVDLLPSNGKGFKPRYDNFDSIVIQLEGQSSWKLYSCLEGFELPRCSSFEIEFDQLPSVVSVEATLNAGDSLYIPKGWTHRQENATADSSLFLTIQINEGNSVADLLETVMPEALSEAIEKKIDMRRSLPRSFHSFMGVASSENDSDPLRLNFTGYTRKLLGSVVEEAMNILDAAADQNAKAFLAARLPIPLTAEEESRTAAGSPGALIYPYTLLRMIRPGVARCIVESGMVVVYHCMDNSRELHGAPLQPLEFELDDGPAIEALLAAYPEAVLVSELPHPSEELEDKISLAQALYREGFLLIHDEASKPENEEEADDDDPF